MQLLRNKLIKEKKKLGSKFYQYLGRNIARKVNKCKIKVLYLVIISSRISLDNNSHVSVYFICLQIKEIKDSNILSNGKLWVDIVSMVLTQPRKSL